MSSFYVVAVEVSIKPASSTIPVVKTVMVHLLKNTLKAGKMEKLTPDPYPQKVCMWDDQLSSSVI